MGAPGMVITVEGMEWHAPTAAGLGEITTFILEAMSAIGFDQKNLFKRLDEVMNSHLLQQKILEMTEPSAYEGASDWMVSEESGCSGLSRAGRKKKYLQFLTMLAYAYEYSYRVRDRGMFYRDSRKPLVCPHFLPPHNMMYDTATVSKYRLLDKVGYCAGCIAGPVLVPGAIFAVIDLFDKKGCGLWMYWLPLEAVCLGLVFLSFRLQRMLAEASCKSWNGIPDDFDEKRFL